VPGRRAHRLILYAPAEFFPEEVFYPFHELGELVARFPNGWYVRVPGPLGPAMGENFTSHLVYVDFRFGSHVHGYPSFIARHPSCEMPGTGCFVSYWMDHDGILFTLRTPFPSLF
jgi:hypothetical protein